jgi:hypothetical protein
MSAPIADLEQLIREQKLANRPATRRTTRTERRAPRYDPVNTDRTEDSPDQAPVEILLSRRVLFTGLPPAVDKATLSSLCSKYGKIRRALVSEDGSGHVLFTDSADAKNAARELNHALVQGTNQPITANLDAPVIKRARGNRAPRAGRSAAPRVRVVLADSEEEMGGEARARRPRRPRRGRHTRPEGEVPDGAAVTDTAQATTAASLDAILAAYRAGK